jgi:coatomer subunit beta
MFHAFITDLPCLANSEVVEKFPHLRQTICERLIQTLGEVKSGKVFRGVLWILGEYVESVPDIQSTLQEIRKVLGEIPILASEQRLLDEANGGEEPEGDASGKKDEKPKEGGGKPRVLADGTYATESAYTSTTTAKLEAVKAAAKPPLRSMFPSDSWSYCTVIDVRVFPSALILGGDFFTGAVLATALAKLVLRFNELTSDGTASNILRAEVCLCAACSQARRY